jgi:hypothetical protein
MNACPNCGKKIGGNRGTFRHHVNMCSTVTERFWAMVNKTEGCWLWMGCKRWDGYGRYNLGPSRQMTAHRRSWELTHGVTLSPKVHVLHLCDNPPCVNPAHLRTGTHLENMADCSRKGRVGNRKLKPEDIRHIRSVPVKWGVKTALARQYGVAPSTIDVIIRGEKWKHL